MSARSGGKERAGSGGAPKGANTERELPRATTRRDALRRLGLALLGASAAGAGLGCAAEDAGAAAGAPGSTRGGGAGGEAGAGATGGSGEGTGTPGEDVGDSGRRVPSPTAVAPIGIQLYTLREPLAADLEGTLARVAGIGYEEVELAGLHGRTPAEFRAALDAAGLVAPSSHVGIDAFDDVERTLDTAEILGLRYLVVPSLPGEMTADEAAWRLTAERFDRAGEAARARGMRVAFHNHAPESRPVGDHPTGLDLFLASTDPGSVGVQADIYWLLEGGADPVAFFGRWPGRVWSLHVKDRAADGAMVDVGAGTVDWATVLTAARRAGAEHFFVEHDRPGDPLASAAASHAHLAALELE